ncbi:PAN domain-containing protein [Roseivivax sp. CAU 1753]
MVPATRAAAEVTRWCQATYDVGPGFSGGTWVQRAFSVSGTHPTNPNRARRNASRRLDICVREHWNLRDSGVRPLSCRDGFADYPFTAFEEEVSALICNANPGHLTLDISISVGRSGNTGCTGEENLWTWEFVSDYRVRCPVGDRLGAQAESATPPARIVPPATLAQPPLPNTRIPGNDLSVFPVGDGGWRACMQACEDDDDCRAWTFRDMLRGSANVCLLKEAVSARISDPCCQSGIKR